MRIAATALVTLALCLFAATAVSSQGNPSNDQPFISDVTVLLPYASERESVSKKLTAANGCFKWFAFLHTYVDTKTQDLFFSFFLTQVMLKPSFGEHGSS